MQQGTCSIQQQPGWQPQHSRWPCLRSCQSCWRRTRRRWSRRCRSAAGAGWSSSDAWWAWSRPPCPTARACSAGSPATQQQAGRAGSVAVAGLQLGPAREGPPARQRPARLGRGAGRWQSSKQSWEWEGEGHKGRGKRPRHDATNMPQTRCPQSRQQGSAPWAAACRCAPPAGTRPRASRQQGSVGCPAADSWVGPCPPGRPGTAARLAGWQRRRLLQQRPWLLSEPGAGR